MPVLLSQQYCVQCAFSTFLTSLVMDTAEKLELMRKKCGKEANQKLFYFSVANRRLFHP
jgi:hypothetical protein